MRTIDQVIASLPVAPCERLPVPEFNGADRDGVRLGLSVASMAHHTTDEGHQLFEGLRSAGYVVKAGAEGYNDVFRLLREFKPATTVIQDKREYVGKTAGGLRTFDPKERFENVSVLKSWPQTFKLTVLKDAQSDRALHVEAAQEAGVHAWVCYYNLRIVAHLCPWVRPEHLVRTWHSLDPTLVPEFGASERSGCLVSGALGLAYPLRTRIVQAARSGRLRNVDWLAHPGYHRRGCATPEYLRTLSRYKVAICTSSVYGYALRKIVEATACGCVVITDLPADEEMPEIDGNLVRVPSDCPAWKIEELVEFHERFWDFDLQRDYANLAKCWYDYRAVGRRLADDIEMLRRNYR